MINRKKTGKNSVVLVGILWLSVLGMAAPEESVPKESTDQGAEELKFDEAIINLQPFSQVQRLELAHPEGDAQGEVLLINLNQFANSWHLLRIRWPNQRNIDWYHLENVNPDNKKLVLDQKFPGGLVIKSEKGEQIHCDLWSADGGLRIKLAKFQRQPFSDICGGYVYLRNNIEGYRTTREWVVEFLRDRVWGGESITNLVKNTIYKDKFLIDSERGSAVEELLSEAESPIYSPRTAQISGELGGRSIKAEDLGIAINDAPNQQMALGRWYPSRDQPGVYVSVMEAQAAHSSILSSHSSYVREMDDVEAKALNYLVAFDLGQFNLDFSIGTEHPRLEWSDRVDVGLRDSNLPGPDGFDKIDPMRATGLVPPHLSPYVAGTFTGGFKRNHAAFRWGELSRTNFGHHYGFMEQGVVFSRLQPDLASIIVYHDGKVEMKTWEESDGERLHLMRHVRQNGVPVIRWDADLEQGVPGEFVSNWTLGNWSGSQDRKFRSLRAGMCLQTTSATQYLIYGYFSSVTPTAMARVFQAYGCDYAMHLDMNALEHTYLAVYAKDKSQNNEPAQLIKGMQVLDQRFRSNVPRFIGYPDNRDFFYLTRSRDQ